MRSPLIVLGLAALGCCRPAAALELAACVGYATHAMTATESAAVPADFATGVGYGVSLTQPVGRFRIAVAAERIPLSEVVDQVTWDFSAGALYLAGDAVVHEPEHGPAWLLGGALGWVVSNGGNGVIDAGQPWESQAETDGSGPLYQPHAGALWPLGRWSLQARAGYRWATANGAYARTGSHRVDIVYDGLVVQLGLGFRL